MGSGVSVGVGGIGVGSSACSTGSGVDGNTVGVAAVVGDGANVEVEGSVTATDVAVC